MLVVDALSLKDSLLRIRDSIWINGSGMEFASLDDKWESIVQPNSLICFLARPDQFDPSSLCSAVRGRVPVGVFPTLKLALIWVLDHPLDTIPESPALPTFLMSSLQRRIGLAGEHHRLSHEELVWQLFGTLLLLSADEAGSANPLFQQSVYTLHISGFVFFERQIVSLDIARSIRQFLDVRKHQVTSLIDYCGPYGSEISLDFSKELPVGIAKDFSRENLRNQFDSGEDRRLFSRKYLESILGRATDVWKQQIWQELVSSCPGVREGIEALDDYIVTAAKLPSNRIVFDYDRPFQATLSEADTILDEFEKGSFVTWRRAKKRFWMTCILSFTVSLILYKLTHYEWVLLIELLLLGAAYLLLYFLPTLSYKSDFRSLSDKLGSLYNQLVSIYRESNLGWLRAHYLSVVETVKQKLESLRKQCELELKALENDEISPPKEWKITSAGERHQISLTLTDFARDEFDFKAFFATCQAEASAFYSNLPGRYGESFGNLNLNEQMLDFHNSEDFAYVAPETLMRSLEPRIARNVLICASGDCIREARIPQEIRMQIEGDDRRLVLIASLEKIG